MSVSKGMMNHLHHFISPQFKEGKKHLHNFVEPYEEKEEAKVTVDN